MKIEAREVEKNLPCPLGMGPATMQRTANSCTVMIRLSKSFISSDLCPRCDTHSDFSCGAVRPDRQNMS